MEERERLVDLLRELATLLELGGENPFKIRAYEGAVRFLETSPLPLSAIQADPPKGFGKGLLEKVDEFQRTGGLAEVDRLKASFPAGVFDLLRVQGLGPKKVKHLFEELGIASLEQLEQACRQDRLLGVKGFGEKSQANILQGLSFLKTFKGQFLYAEAEAEAARLVGFLRERLGPDLPLEVAGSLRRRKEVVKDVDLLAASDGPAAVMAAFLAWPGKARVLAEGETKSAIVLASGLQVDLRVVPPDSFGPALCYFTGSKEHNTQVRGLAQDLGCKLNEYGLYRDGKASPMATEEEVYQALGLPFIPPELREGLDEIELARAGRLPDLDGEADLRGALHAHSTFSDGRATVAEMAAAAKKLGWSWFGLSDHSRSAHYAHGLEVDRVREQWAVIDDLNARSRKFQVLKGIESDILADGGLDYPREVLEGFDFVVASVHAQMSMPAAEMTKRVLVALENPFTAVLGHPTGRLLLEREGFGIDLEAVLGACVRLGVAVEINANPHRLDLDWRRIRAWRESGLRFVIGPDAHEPAGLAHVRLGVGLARKGGLTRESLLNCLDADEARAALRARRRNHR